MKTIQLLIAALLLSAITACNNDNQNRIPISAVRLSFLSPGDWQLYGVSGALDFKTFVKPDVKPNGFFFTAMSETGYGGILLVGNTIGEPMAYDLSCPVEAQRNIRVFINVEKSIAQCPKCGSTYNVFYSGDALSGEAAQLRYSLKRYRVSMPGPQNEYAYISN